MQTQLQTQYQESRRAVKEYISGLKRNSFRRKVEIEAAHLFNKIDKYDLENFPILLEYVGYEIDRLGEIVKKK